MDRINLTWSRKLLRTRNFVVITDDDAVIRIKGGAPETMEDMIQLASQQAAMVMFRDRLNKLIKAHGRILHGEEPKKAKGKKKVVIR